MENKHISSVFYLIYLDDITAFKRFVAFVVKSLLAYPEIIIKLI